MAELKGKIVWLTGASSGIGEALAYELALRGAIVALSARNREALEKLSAELIRNGSRAIAVPCDVCDVEETKQAARTTREKLGEIDIVIANAGTHIFTVPEQFDSAEYLSLMDLNYGGLLRTIEAIIPQMLARKSGHIVGVASMSGYRALPMTAAYGASKAAAIHFLESVRFHFEKQNVAVSVVNPGFVKTPLTDKNNFRMPFLIDAATAARIICDGIEQKKRVISFPFPFTWIMRTAQFLPYPLYRIIVRNLWKRM